MHRGQGDVTLAKIPYNVRGSALLILGGHLASIPGFTVTLLCGFDPAMKTLAPLPAILSEARIDGPLVAAAVTLLGRQR